MSGRLNISANAAVTYLFTGFGLAPSQGAPAAHFELSCQDAVDVWVGATTEHLVALTPSNAGSGAAVSWTAMLGPEPEHTMATGGDQRIRLGGERAVAMAIFNPWEKSVEGSFSLEGTSGNTTIRMQPGVTERLTHMGPPGEHTVTFDIERTSSVPFWGVLAGVDEVTDEGLYRMTGTPLPTRH